MLKLLEFPFLKDRIVTTDAVNCRCDIAREIVDRTGDYVLALKANHRTLHADIGRLLEQARYKVARKYSTVDARIGESRIICTGF